MNKKKSYMNLRNCIIEKVGPPNFSLGHHYSIVSGPVGRTKLKMLVFIPAESFCY